MAHVAWLVCSGFVVERSFAGAVRIPEPQVCERRRRGLACRNGHPRRMPLSTRVVPARVSGKRLVIDELARPREDIAWQLRSDGWLDAARLALIARDWIPADG